MQSNLHVAIIMDGNGRWAGTRMLPRAVGHRAGAEALRHIVEASPSLGIATLTVYAFSSDNWKRPVTEVAALMSLLKWYLETETPRCVEDGVRLSVIGRRDRLDASVARAIDQAESKTRTGRTLHLRIAIDYSARESIVRAVERCETMPDPVDLLIRTGGEQRLSDFLLWEVAYAELFFTPVMWPEFSVADLRRILQEFVRRDRRFGGLPEQPPVLPSHGDRWLR